MSGVLYTGYISVSHELREGGYWVLTSDDLAGFLLCGKDLEKLQKDVPNVIAGLFKLNYGMTIEAVSDKEILVMKQDTFTLDEGQAVLQYPSRFTSESYEYFKAGST